MKGDEERALLRALRGRGAAFLAAIKASTSLRSSSIAASMLMVGLLDCEAGPREPRGFLYGWLMMGSSREWSRGLSGKPVDRFVCGRRGSRRTLGCEGLSRSLWRGNGRVFSAAAGAELARNDLWSWKVDVEVQSGNKQHRVWTGIGSGERKAMVRRGGSSDHGCALVKAGGIGSEE